MSTDFILHRDGVREVSVTESSATFSLDLWGYSDQEWVFGPQHMAADEALRMAARLMYAVWCSYPTEAEEMAQNLAEDIIKFGCVNPQKDQ